MFLSDHQIIRRAKDGMIRPFQEKQTNLYAKGPVGEGFYGISSGVSSYGYDARLDNSFLIPKFDQHASLVVDPKMSSPKDYEHVVRDTILIPPHSFVLGQTIEVFKIPRDVLALCIGKSTYARCGIIVNVTPLEPEWEGTVTIEISNTNVKPAKIYAGEGIAQFLFAWCQPEIEFDYNNGVRMENNICQTSYADRKGKYQGQREVTLPR